MNAERQSSTPEALSIRASSCTSMFDVTESRLHQHAPLHAVIRFGKAGAERSVPVKLISKLTEVGTLELWADSKVSENRWRLQFELRKQVAAETAGRPAAVLSEDAVNAAAQLIRDAFERFTLEPEQLPAKLEQALGLGRASWPLGAIRKFADVFLELAAARKRGAPYELRWLNLAGLCLRPGFGYPGDDYRIEQARRIFAGGLTFANAVQNESEWWIFWGRVAGGLTRNQQTDIYQRLSATLQPKRGERARVNSSLLREMWRCASSLELLPAGTRNDLGEALVKRVVSGEGRESELWCLARLGARELFYGPTNQVLAAGTVSRWVEALANTPLAAEALASMARRTGDSYRDMPPATVALARRAIESHKDAAKLLALLEGKGGRDAESLSRIFGEELPSGLQVAVAEQSG